MGVLSLGRDDPLEEEIATYSSILARKNPWTGEPGRLYNPWGLKELDPGSIPGSGRSPGEGNATHSSVLAWSIPWTEEPGGLQSIVLQRVGHD